MSVREVIIWGAGANGKRIYSELMCYYRETCRIIGFGDNNHLLLNKNREEGIFKDRNLDGKYYKVLSFEEVVDLYRNNQIDGVIIGVSQRHIHEIEKQFEYLDVPIWKTVDEMGIQGDPMLQRPFPIDDNNLLLNNSFENDNFRIVDAIDVKKNKDCIIFCSSNGLYFPNDYGTFQYSINECDRYEWENIGIKYENKVGRIVYLRDVRKSFYVTGISKKNDSINSIIRLLQKITNGYKCIVVGVSGGGYLASIICMNLYNAVMGFVFSGQADLLNYSTVRDYYFLKKYSNDRNRSKFFDISGELKKNVTPIFYFYASDCEQDEGQTAIYKNIASSIYPYAIKSNSHGVNLPYNVLINLFKMDVKFLQEMSLKYENEILSKEEWEIRLRIGNQRERIL